MTHIRRSLTISNETRHLSLVRTVVSEVLDASTFDGKTRNKIVVAVDEALANVVEHAYQGGTGPIELGFDLDPEKLVVRIRDNGVRFEPSAARLSAQIDIKEHIRLGLKGGLGLFLMRQIMDEIQYVHDTEFVNELILMKKQPPPAEAPPEG